MEYVVRGELQEAFASFTSDMRKHPELCDHSALGLGSMLLMGGHVKTAPEMDKWINGFN
jgi:hypothetical protein